MTSSSMRVAIAAVRAWTRVYTWHMPAALREGRRAEIESDLWEFQEDAAGRRGPGHAAHVLFRLVLGIPDDLCWRMEQAAVDAPQVHGRIALGAYAVGAALFLTALWAIDADAERRRSGFAFAAPTAVVDQERLSPLAAGIVATIRTAMLPAVAAESAPPASVFPRFEAVSIAPNKSGSPLPRMAFEPAGRFTATNASLGMLIEDAYQLSALQITGGPPWIDSDRFDVVAKGEAGARPDRIRLMLQSLLAERFGLRVHVVTRELPVYALVVARRDGRLGPQLRRTRLSINCYAASIPPPGEVFPNALPPCGYFGPAPGFANLAFRGMTMEGVAGLLKPMLRRNVIDRTGLAGHFDGDFDFTAEIGPPPPPPGTPDPFDREALPTIFTVLQEQLGLQLQSQLGWVGVLVIDRAVPPSPDGGL
jgi:uncharacterized protein (TIGR03435 family)